MSQSEPPDDEARQQQLRVMRESLAKRAEDFPIGSLLPVLVPASFFEFGTWPGQQTRWPESVVMHALEEHFPDGYRIAMPEMSCGIALSAKATDLEVAKIEDLVAQCYENGTRPLIPGLHPPIDLA